MLKRIMRICIVILVCTMGLTTGCTDYVAPESTPYLDYCDYSVPPVTPTPVYKRPENPVEAEYYLTCIELPDDIMQVVFFSKEHSCSDNMLIYTETIDGEKLYGYMDMKFNKLSQPISKVPGYFVNGLARIVGPDGVRIIDKDFRTIETDHRLPFEYKGQWTEVCILSDGRYKLIGYENNQEIFELDDYYYGMDFDEYSDADTETHLVPCYKKSEADGDVLLWGFKQLNNAQDPGSEFVIEPVYDEAGKFREGLAAVKKDEKWGYINQRGEVIIDFEYDHATEFNGGMAGTAIFDPARAQYDPQPLLWGLINIEGKQLAEYRYSYYVGVSDGIAHMYRHGEGHYFFDSTGGSLFDAPILAEYSFNEGFTVTRNNSTVRAIDKSGEDILEGKYTEIYYYNPGLLHVRVNNKAAVINLNEEFLIIPKYRHITAFDMGFALASYKSGEAFFIDLAGNEYLNGLDFTNVSKFSDDGYALAYSDKGERKYYLIHIEKNE